MMNGILIRRFWMILLLCGGVLLWSASVQARSPHGGKGPKGNSFHLIEQHADEMGIDDDLLEAIWEIADAARPEGRKLRRALREMRKELHALLQTDDPDRGAVMAQIERIGEAEVALRKHDLNTLLDVRSLLTPEQRKALDSLAPPHGKEGRHGSHGKRQRRGTR